MTLWFTLEKLLLARKKNPNHADPKTYKQCTPTPYHVTWPLWPHVRKPKGLWRVIKTVIPSLRSLMVVVCGRIQSALLRAVQFVRVFRGIKCDFCFCKVWNSSFYCVQVYSGNSFFYFELFIQKCINLGSLFKFHYAFSSSLGKCNFR